MVKMVQFWLTLSVFFNIIVSILLISACLRLAYRDRLINELFAMIQSSQERFNSVYAMLKKSQERCKYFLGLIRGDE